MNTKSAQKLYQAVLRQRRNRIVKMREKGMTLIEIATRLGITRQRVWAILESLNKDTND